MNIIVADDHALARRGLRQIIESQQWNVAAEVAKADELLPALRHAAADVAVLDCSVELIRTVRAEFPALPMLILSLVEERQHAIDCLRAGASGFLSKDGSPEQIVEAIRQVAAGRMHMSDDIAEQLANELLGDDDSPSSRA